VAAGNARTDETGLAKVDTVAASTPRPPGAVGEGEAWDAASKSCTAEADLAEVGTAAATTPRLPRTTAGTEVTKPGAAASDPDVFSQNNRTSFHGVASLERDVMPAGAAGPSHTPMAAL